MIVYLKY